MDRRVEKPNLQLDSSVKFGRLLMVFSHTLKFGDITFQSEKQIRKEIYLQYTFPELNNLFQTERTN